MKALKYLLPLWAAIAVYSVLSLFYGANGFYAYDQLLAGRDVQWANMNKLGAINSELENARNDLLYDRDAVGAYAQSLGFGRDDEKFVRIVGLGGIKNPYTDTGDIITTQVPGFIPDKTIKLCSLFTGISIVAVMLVFGRFRRRSP